MSNHNEPRPSGGRFWLPILVFGGAIIFLLLYEHRAHIPGNAALLVGFLLLCGVMHLFMHGGHSGHGGHGGQTHADSDNDQGAGR